VDQRTSRGVTAGRQVGGQIGGGRGGYEADSRTVTRADPVRALYYLPRTPAALSGGACPNARKAEQVREIAPQLGTHRVSEQTRYVARWHGPERSEPVIAVLLATYPRCSERGCVPLRERYLITPRTLATSKRTHQSLPITVRTGRSRPTPRTRGSVASRWW
jgi:hypothetical protein